MSANPYCGEERRKPISEDRIKNAVKEAMQDVLKGNNIIDGPTHIAHHQAIADFLQLAAHAKKTFIGMLIMGLCSLIVLGISVWKGHS